MERMYGWIAVAKGLSATALAHACIVAKAEARIGRAAERKGIVGLSAGALPRLGERDRRADQHA